MPQFYHVCNLDNDSFVKDMKFYAQTWYKAHGYPAGYHGASDWSWCNSLKEQFSIKENWWVRCWPSYKRICFFPPISWLPQLLGEVLGATSLVGSCFLCNASAKPERSQELGSLGRIRSQAAFFFFSCSGKTPMDVQFYETYGFCSGAVDGQLGAYNMWLSCSPGSFHSRAFSFIYPYVGSQRAVRTAVQYSWLFWGFEVPVSSSVF